MKAILKYPLDKSTKLSMPSGAIVQHVGMQADRITLWVEVDRDATDEPRTFTIIGTGQPMLDQEQYVGTVFDGAYVWHVCEARS